MVKLQHDISQFVTGFVHVQTNPVYSFDTEKMVTNARSRFKTLFILFKQIWLD